MPRATAALIASRLASGSWLRLSRSVPSMSMAIRWITSSVPIGLWSGVRAPGMSQRADGPATAELIRQLPWARIVTMDPRREFEGVNAGYVAELYDRYQRDPSSVDEGTRAAFARWTPPADATPVRAA